MNDINSKTDVELIVRKQYSLLLENHFTAPVFAHLNLEEHLPRIFTFWCFVLGIDASNNSYRGSAFEPHTKLGLTAQHFNLWLQFLHQTIRENFSGANADKWIQKSTELGLMFQYKMGLVDDESFLIKKSDKPS